VDKQNWTAVANEVGRKFAERIAEHDANDRVRAPQGPRRRA
jgi:hypothetical protein